jgi:hypothetical protein
MKINNTHSGDEPLWVFSAGIKLGSRRKLLVQLLCRRIQMLEKLIVRAHQPPPLFRQDTAASGGTTPDTRSNFTVYLSGSSSEINREAVPFSVQMAFSIGGKDWNFCPKSAFPIDESPFSCPADGKISQGVKIPPYVVVAFRYKPQHMVVIFDSAL